MPKQKANAKPTQVKKTKVVVDYDPNKKYPIADAIELVKQLCKCKFDSTIEAHFNLNINVKKPEETVRVTTTLPHGTGKTLKVAVLATTQIKGADLQLSESDIDLIKNGQLKPKLDFDVLVAQPRYMPKLAKVAPILGPAGMMPNPKSGTVTEDVEKAVELIKKGKVELRNEANAPIIHTVLGKKSFKTTNLVENFAEIISTLKQNKPQKAKVDYVATCFISSTMSPSVSVVLE